MVFKKLIGVVLLLVGSALATTTYVSQAGGVISDGSNCNGQTAVSIATYNSGTQSAGDIIWFDGTITTAPVTHGSGSAGNVITYNWCTGARISVAHGQIIEVSGSTHHLLFDGEIACGPATNCNTVESTHQRTYATGQAGIIEATANGSGLANQDPQTQAFWGCNGCHDIEIRNMIIRNLYIHSGTSDQTGSADTGTFVFQCPEGNSGCGSGTISIHDATIHDLGLGMSMERGVSGTVDSLYSIDFYHMNWAAENSGDGLRTFQFHDNLCHDTSNWDTSGDAFHHNCVHGFMNTATDSTSWDFYNNYSYGNWGSCCTTATLMYIETDLPNNVHIFNNVDIQACDGETAPALEIGGTNALVVNNTLKGCGTQSGNSEAIVMYGNGWTFKNNAIESYGQYVVIQPGWTFTAADYNSYGASGMSGNSPWQCGASSDNTFAAWQAACSADSHGQKVSSLNVSATGVPLAGSALIGAGTNLTSLAITALNSDTSLGGTRTPTARPSVGAWDAGAFVASGPITPVFAPNGGTFTTNPSVTITCGSGATCCYTTNGVTPTAATPGTCDQSTYSTPVTIPSTSTLKAIGTEVGFTNSSVASALFTMIPLIAPGTLAFGNQTVNTTSAGQVETFTNNTGATITFTSVVLTTGTQFAISANTCTGTLTNTSSCTTTITFTPTTAGAKSDTLTYTDSDASSPQTVSLTGTGVAGGGGNAGTMTRGTVLTQGASIVQH